jgi:hypothetical protein
MSIYFSVDAHLTKIEKLSKLDRFRCPTYYRVYGLKQENNPPMLISYQKMPEFKTTKEIRNLLKRYGIPVEFEELKFDSFTIGLRKDLREHEFLAAAAINCLVGYLENKVAIFNASDLGFKRINKNFLEKIVDFSHIGL